MIIQSSHIDSCSADTDAETVAGEDPQSTRSSGLFVLARYGRVPQVARFSSEIGPVRRGCQVICETDRGEEIAVVLEQLPHLSAATSDEVPPPTGAILRNATDEDRAVASRIEHETEATFSDWLQRVAKWKLQLELIDLEKTLDGKLILYVLNNRGAETTRLALLTAAAGLGIVHVQPVSADGVITAEQGGCGSAGGGCGSGGCGH